MTFEQAAADLQRKSFEAGFGGVIDDINVALCEDLRTVSLWAFYEWDYPLMASFELPQPIEEDDLDYEEYERRLRAVPVELMF